MSSGSDAAPDWTYLADEIVRRGHAWVGRLGAVRRRRGRRRGGGRGRSWRRPASRPDERYAALDHPGDAYGYWIYTSVAAALHDGPLADLVVDLPAGGRASRSRRSR